jgi:hypothetical protein
MIESAPLESNRMTHAVVEDRRFFDEVADAAAAQLAVLFRFRSALGKAVPVRELEALVHHPHEVPAVESDSGLKLVQVRLEQVKRSLGIPCIDARSPQTDYAAFLLLYDAPPLGDELLGAAKIAFGIHLSKQRARGDTGTGLIFVRHPHPRIAVPAGVEVRRGRTPEFAVSLGGHHNILAT